ncbi:hypothetical protein D3C71_1712800 [compost metagenome]
MIGDLVRIELPRLEIRVFPENAEILRPVRLRHRNPGERQNAVDRGVRIVAGEEVQGGPCREIKQVQRHIAVIQISRRRSRSPGANLQLE